METKEDIKIREILEKEEPLHEKKKKNKPQFGVNQVPNYGKSRSGKEYGGFIKESHEFLCLLLFPYPFFLSEYNIHHDQLVNLVDQWFTNIKKL